MMAGGLWRDEGWIVAVRAVMLSILVVVSCYLHTWDC